MLSNLLNQRKSVIYSDITITIKKLPVRFREWAALRLYEITDGKAKVKEKYEDVLEVNLETIYNGVVDIDGQMMTRELAKEIATNAPDLAEFLLDEINKFSTLSEEAKKK